MSVPTEQQSIQMDLCTITSQLLSKCCVPSTSLSFHLTPRLVSSPTKQRRFYNSLCFSLKKIEDTPLSDPSITMCNFILEDIFGICDYLKTMLSPCENLWILGIWIFFSQRIEKVGVLLSYWFQVRWRLGRGHTMDSRLMCQKEQVPRIFLHISQMENGNY